MSTRSDTVVTFLLVNDNEFIRFLDVHKDTSYIPSAVYQVLVAISQNAKELDVSLAMRYVTWRQTYAVELRDLAYTYLLQKGIKHPEQLSVRAMYRSL